MLLVHRVAVRQISFGKSTAACVYSWRWVRRTVQRPHPISLAGNQPLKITLVDPTERFVFLPLLYELAVGETALWEAALRIQPDSRFKHRIEFIGFVAGERTKWPNRAAASGWDHTSARV